MYSKTPTGKASKGTVQILNSNGRLQLRFRAASKRHYISLGLADTAPNRKLAEMKAREIELDMLSGHFDQTLAKYKPHSAFTTDSPDITPKITPTLQELWKAYTEYRASSVKETTQQYHASFTRLFDRLTELVVLDALAVKAELEQKTTLYQTKRALMQLSAACKWAKKHRQ
jgi:integrase